MPGHPKKMQLKQKIKRLFDESNCLENQIANQIMPQFHNYEQTRNKIAHAREKLDISRQEAKEFSRFTLTLILSFELNALTFEELIHQIS